MQELDQTQELIQMLKERLNEKDETIATLQATIKNLEATVKMLQENAVDLKATIANLTETLNEFKRKFFGISSEKSKKKQTDEPVCDYHWQCHLARCSRKCSICNWVYGQKGSGTVNKRLTNCEQIFEKSRMASNENS